MQLLRLVQTQVRLGEPLRWGVRDPQGQLLLARGQVITSEAQLAALLERGASVDIEEVRAAAAQADSGRQRPVSLFGQWEQLLWQLDRTLRSVAEPGFPERLEQVRAHLEALTLRDPDIAVYLTVRQDPKRLTIYPLAHSVHCTLIGLLMARRLGWDEARTQSLMRAALTMNIAILELQGRMAAQGSSPTPGQLETIRAHPSEGVRLLRDAGVTDAPWLDAVGLHHERPDGGGYPEGRREIGELPTVLRWIDVFMAKLAPRALRTPVPVQLAARQLYTVSGSAPAAAAIIKEFGIYPPGEFVQLNSGEMAVVVRRSADARTPLAASVTDRHGMPSVNTVVRDTAKPEFAITGLAPDKNLVLRVPPERLFGIPD
jgi:HD-GYP domain-containing protein (c-di-GMP phosphodiesterase class II)